ncbi:MAG TPA: hypothetical protein VMV56_01115 [Williamwhitmania sp.]|nr:hypothetical protein [Williamwhitmania sp.]
MATQESLQQVKVVKLDRIGPNGYLLTTIRPFEFTPGQVVKLTTDKTIAPRLYSIASGSSEATLKFLFDLKNEGELTPKLLMLQPGDKVWMSEPFGEFVCDEKPAIWVASGTGIAPFLSMALSGNTHNKKLVHGVRYAENFFFHEEMRELLHDNYIQCLSGEARDGTFHGRVTDFLKQDEALSLNIKYYLCGNPEMVVDARDILLARGVIYDNIHAEIYF